MVTGGIRARGRLSIQQQQQQKYFNIWYLTTRLFDTNFFSNMINTFRH